MIFGYLFPNNEIYSLKFEHKGKFEIEKDEKIILKAKNIEINIAKYGWGNYFSLDDALDKGIGNMIKTNKRLIYQREIDPLSKNRFWDFAPYALIEIWKAKKYKEKGMKEYFEVYYDEIIGFDEFKIPLFSGLEIYICNLKNYKGIPIKNYYSITFRKRYKIIDDPLILKKELTKTEIKEMKKEEKEYIEYINDLDLDNI